MTAWKVIQAEGSGVTAGKPLDEVASGGALTLVRPPAFVEPTHTLTFAHHNVGDHYAWWTIAAIALEIVTPSWFHVPFRRPGTWICSAIVAESLRFGGWLLDWPDIYTVTPAQLLDALLTTGGERVSVEEAAPGDVGFGHSSGLIPRAIRFGQRINREPDWWVNHAFLVDRAA